MEGGINLVSRKMCDECDAFLGKPHKDGCSKGGRAVIEADTSEKFTTVEHVEREEPLLVLNADAVELIVNHTTCSQQCSSQDPDHDKFVALLSGLRAFIAAAREVEAGASE